MATAEARTIPGDSNKEEVTLLEKEIQIQKEFTEHILSTVYFCLGTVIVVLLAMIGFSQSKLEYDVEDSDGKQFTIPCHQTSNNVTANEEIVFLVKNPEKD